VSELPEGVTLWKGGMLLPDALLHLGGIKLSQLYRLRGIVHQNDQETYQRYGTSIVRIVNRDELVEALHKVLVQEAVDLLRRE
jgi:hypothetical protein